MATVATLITRTRELINITDTSSPLISNTEITAFINVWHRDISARLEWDKKEWTATSVTGQRTYDLPSTMMLLEALYWTINGKDVTELDIISEDSLKYYFGRAWRSNANGVPKVGYWADALVLGVHPFPDSNNAGTNYIRLLGVPYPDDLISTSTPVVPTVFHDTSAFFAASICFEKLGEQDKASRMMNIYEIMLKKLRPPATRKANDLRRIRWGIRQY